jgi:Tol biopolymer transport system component
MFAVVQDTNTLCVYSAKTFEEVSCGSPGAESRLQDVIWSPDGSKLAFTNFVTEESEDSDIWVMDSLTGNLKNLTDDGFPNLTATPSASIWSVKFYIDLAPAWTPDSSFLTFVRSPLVYGNSQGTDIAQVSANGGIVETLATVSETEPFAVLDGTAWSPDGSTFYFSQNSVRELQQAKNGIWSYNNLTKKVSNVIYESEAGFLFLSLLELSPQGDQILVWDPVGFGLYSTPDPNVQLVDASTGTLSPIRQPATGPEAIPGLLMATFSPDGGSLLLFVNLGNRQHEVWISDLAGSRYIKVQDALQRVYITRGMTPTWGRNGNVLIPRGLNGGYLLSLDAESLRDGAVA